MGERNEIMGREIRQQKIRIHNKILLLRSIERILKSEDFEYVFENASDEERKKVEWILKTENLDNLKSWLRRLSEESLITMSSRKLKDICKRNSVPYWSRLTREEMIEALNAAGLG